MTFFVLWILAGLAFQVLSLPIAAAIGLQRQMFLASAADDGPNGVTLYTERNFFGTVQVVRSRDGKYVRLVHGANL